MRTALAVLEGGYNGRVIKWLGRLLRVELDALWAYRRALRHVADETIRRRIERHIGEHEEHVTALEGAICDVGGDMPLPTRSLKGWLIELFVALRSSTGTEGALTAIKGNEDLAAKCYARVLRRNELPPRVRALVRSLRDDLLGHAEWLVVTLSGLRPQRES